MSEDYLPHIFEEFTREHTSTESKVVGTGLGLPIVKSLVEWMHGSIDIQSKLGEGTTVTITLEFPLADEPQKGEQEQTVQRSAAQLKGCRILLAEDNDLNAEIAQTILEEAGLIVERAADGVLCIDALKTTPWAITTPFSWTSRCPGWTAIRRQRSSAICRTTAASSPSSL